MEGILQYGALGIVLVISMGLMRIIEAAIKRATGNKNETSCFNSAAALRLEEIHRTTGEMAKVLARLADVQERQAQILERMENRR